MTDQKPAPYGRGQCVECDRWFNLTKDGHLRHHGALGVFPPERCPGAGWPSKGGVRWVSVNAEEGPPF